MWYLVSGIIMMARSHHQGDAANVLVAAQAEVVSRYCTVVLDWHSLKIGTQQSAFPPLAHGVNQLWLALPKASPFHSVLLWLPHAFCPFRI